MNWLVALSVQNAPPVSVPDARRSLAVWCVPDCSDVDALVDSLDARVRLPRRATTSHAAVGLHPAGWIVPPEGVTADEVVVVRFASPVPGAEPRVERFEAAVFEWAGARPIEDLDTGRMLTRPPEDLADRVVLDWSGDRVVTRGLRGVGVHDLTVANVPEELAAELGTVLVWLAAHALEDPRPYESRTLRVEEIEDAQLQAWLTAAVWKSNDEGVLQPGTGEGRVELRNFVPREGDPAGPLLEVGFEGEWADPDSLAVWLDRVYGTGLSPTSESSP